jgi:hypothetical protein
MSDYLYPTQNMEWFTPFNLTNLQSPTSITGSYGFYGLGCGSWCYVVGVNNGAFGNLSTWAETVQTGGTYQGWSDLGLQATGNGSAFEVALFTDPPEGSTSVQNPWVMDTAGQAFYWNNGAWQFVTTPEPIVAITDHYVLGRSCLAWHWAGNSGGGGNATWDSLVENFDFATGTPVTITRIAWSQAIGGVQGVGTIGPSDLWGIDANGVIYSAQVAPRIPTPIK